VGDHVFSIEISAPPERVFDLWVDVKRMPEWTEGLTRITNLSGPPGEAGTRYSAWFGRSRASVEILAADRPRHVAWAMRYGPLAAEIDCRFESLAAGTRMTETIRTRGVVGSIWARILAAGSYRGSFRGELATFASLCGPDGPDGPDASGRPARSSTTG